MSIISAKYNNKSVPANVRRAAAELSHLTCKLSPGGWIAGGAMRSRIARETLPSDYDCYFTCAGDLDNAKIQILNDPELKANKIYEDNTVLCFDTFIGKVDLVKRYYDCPESCLYSFDFTCCAFAIRDNRAYWLPRGLTDLRNRKLVLYRPTCPLSTMLRLQKYALKGYSMDLENHIMLANLIKSKDILPTIDRLLDRKNQGYPVETTINGATKAAISAVLTLASNVY